MNSTTATAVSGTGRAPPMPKSPFFRPSSIKKKVGGKSNDLPLEDREKKTSLLGAYANLCNVTIGAGIVGLPYAIKQTGLIAGVIMVLICAILTDYSLRLVISCGKLVNVNSYETLLEAAFGRPGFIFLSLNMFFLSYGSLVAYLIIIKDVLPVLFHVTPHDIDIKRVIMFVSSVLVIVPLSMQRDMADLEKTSRLNVLINICLVALVVIFSPVNESVEARGGILQMVLDEPFLDFSTFFVGFGVCSFAFVCQDSSFIIAGSMKTPSRQRWKQVTNGAMLTCCTLELTLGITGYLAYQTNTVGNVLNNMNVHHWSGVVSRAMLSVTMFFAYPMNLYIARHAFIVLFFQGTTAHEGDDSIVLTRKDRRVTLTWALYIASLIPAILMESTGKVLAVTGAIAGSSIAYIAPGMTFLAIHSNEFIELVHKRWNASSKQLWGYPKEFVDDMGASKGVNQSQHLQFIREKGKEHGHIVGYPMESDNQRKVPKASKLDVFLWYVFGMPIWSNIAQIGKTKLAEHFKKDEMMSPSVVKRRRVSVVKPTWHPPGFTQEQPSANVGSITRSPSDPMINGDTNNTEETVLLQPYLGSPYGSNDVAGNDGVAKMIASANSSNGSVLHRTNSLSSVEVKIELQNEVPTWVDFVIAIAYIVLG
eukprot:CAMPEP_0172316770 /NCGR_PEP_ID=MMETSP1058-20130122/29437_1 /TAXON_ID=83371 /ORGANISM="Detonula confervacea, Strain CCMP 353" /LENGTH=648 /DNA_ID=CAMNT_0013031175 /DNA_START=281 /DNA_END=2224 /DNA_ORIENTATION=-